MNRKMKDCFTPHIYMHSLFGLGLGLLVADIWGGLAKWWLGIILMVLAAVLDMMRKS
jgi:hypothetical protein